MNVSAQIHATTQRLLASCSLLAAVTVLCACSQTMAADTQVDDKGPTTRASDPKEFEARLQEVRGLEQRAEFSRALEVCAALKKNFADRPELTDAICDVSKRVAAEKTHADAVGFAVTSLADPGCAEIATQTFREAGETGRLILRHAYHNSNDELKLVILKQLQTMKDERLAELLSERLLSNPADPQRQAYVEMLWPTLQSVPATGLPGLPALFALAKREPDKNKDLSAYLLAAARRAGADQPAEFAKLFGDEHAFEHFKNLNMLNTVCSDGLVVCFNFDEKAGATAANAVPHGRTADAKATWVPGKKDGAIHFNGADEILTYSDPALELGKTDFTLAFWLYLENGPTGGWRNITHKGYADDQRTFAIWLRPDSNALHCRISTLGNGNDGVEATVTQIPLNTWTHVTYMKKENALKIYINGQKDSELPVYSRVLYNSGPIYIGKDPWYAGPASAIDDYRIYTRALTEGEIRLLAGLPYP